MESFNLLNVRGAGAGAVLKNQNNILSSIFVERKFYKLHCFKPPLLEPLLYEY